mmetsp:Transcript_6636/g.16869  ORF Transcript_6636/g.16869 Transcript_6636/m.16869 type:complete len:198 (+) Transcript_6636:465-1058(+)|eukprot:CAMPEP_0119475736 /NCGR_PEP_ID=MMETSP1344-20130328/6510_1 /TAXON_ID=236787 /ORGANISM="Florenciella parvula, Strain CCMP2471" /LENGTH=197 /DNA_ID=CAMNT_0007509323 /DNA_START=432 /DNA_END=1025 /DNA_ORIENTATION=-
MGRYTTVQTFSDNNPSVVKVPYDEKAASSNSSSDGGGRGDEHGSGYKVEKVNNVSGSTAGAGSGDFHHYRHTRRVEVMRLENLDKVAKARAEEDAFAERVESKRKECEERTKKNAEKRRRKRQKRDMAIEQKKKNGGAEATGTESSDVEKEAADEKFSYTPIFVPSKDVSAVEKGVAEAVVKDDGSFMDTMRKVMGK